MTPQQLSLIVPIAPLIGAILSGLFGKLIGRKGAHIVTILDNKPLFHPRCRSITLFNLGQGAARYNHPQIL